MQKGNLKLKGDWAFYRGKFIAPNADFSAYESKREWVKIPGNWRYEKEGEFTGSTGIGTYRATFYFQGLPEKMAIHVQRISSAYDLYINGIKIGSHGQLAQNIGEGYAGKVLSRHFDFVPTSDTLTVVVHIANFSVRNGGIERPFLVGIKSAIQQFYEHQIAWDLFLVGAFLMTSCYHFFWFLSYAEIWQIYGLP